MLPDDNYTDIDADGVLRKCKAGTFLRCRPVFTHDNKYLACGCDNMVQLYSLKTHQLCRRLDGHEKPVSGLISFQDNPNELLSYSVDGAIILWGLKDGTIIKNINIHGQLMGLYVLRRDLSRFLLHVITTDESGFSSSLMATAKLHKSSGEWELVPLAKACKKKSVAYSEKLGVAACFRGNCLEVLSVKVPSNRRVHKVPNFWTCMEMHPVELQLAAASSDGAIYIWSDLFSPNPPVTKLHWHAHSIGDLHYSLDGHYLYSAGEESVLVTWQLGTLRKSFMPRMGTFIKQIALDRLSCTAALVHQDDVVQLVSLTESRVVGKISSYLDTSDTRLGLLHEPGSGFLVMNSLPGILQFYNPETDTVVCTLDVVGQNLVSRMQDSPTSPLQVTLGCFLDYGRWLVVVESRSGGIVSLENKLKFFWYDLTQQRFELSTVIDPPHSDQTLSLSGRQGGAIEPGLPFVVTTSQDGYIKLWTLAEPAGDSNSAEKQVHWYLHSRERYLPQPAALSAFSQDGSTLAVSYDHIITLWSLPSMHLTGYVVCPETYGTTRSLTLFSAQSETRLLACCSRRSALFNVGLLRLLDCISVDLTASAFDSATGQAALFGVRKSQKQVFLWDLQNPDRAAVSRLSLPCKDAVVSAVFVPCRDVYNKKRFRFEGSLFFITEGCVLWELSEQQRAFFHAPELSKELPISVLCSQAREQGIASTPKASKSLRLKAAAFAQAIGGPGHTMPHPRALCQTFFRFTLGDPHFPRQDQELAEPEDTDMPSAEESDSDHESDGAGKGIGPTTSLVVTAASSDAAVVTTSPAPPPKLGRIRMDWAQDMWIS